MSSYDQKVAVLFSGRCGHDSNSTSGLIVLIAVERYLCLYFEVIL